MSTYELIDGEGEIIDDVDVAANGNGELRLFWQQSELPLNIAVVASNPAANFDLTMNVLRHRITGIV
jgi:hypothetical protein